METREGGGSLGSQPPLEGLQIQMVGSWKCQAEGLGLYPEGSGEPF